LPKYIKGDMSFVKKKEHAQDGGGKVQTGKRRKTTHIGKKTTKRGKNKKKKQKNLITEHSLL